MRAGRTGLSAAAAVAVVGCLVVPAAAPAAARVGASCTTSQLQLVRGGGTSLAGSVPVVFIHGIISNAARLWKASTPGSMAYQAARVSGVTAWTFDYGPESLDWVTNPAIGPAFASGLACLANASGRKVIVVAHSMGGLATQYAVAQPDPSGGTVGSHVAEVITIGTPYQGSELLTAMHVARFGFDLSPSGIEGEAVLSACAGHTSGICALPAVLPSQVGTDLQLHSAAIAQLPPWPARLPVLDIAGDMGLLIGIGHLFVVHRFDVGDAAVTVGSATAHNTTSGPVIKHCNSLKLLGAIYGNPGPCFHSHLVNDGDIITDVLAAIRADSTAMALLMRYSGSWYDPTQGVELTVDSGGLGILRANGESCGKPGGQPTCVDSWHIKFSVRDGTTNLDGIVTSNIGRYMGNETGKPVVLALTSNRDMITMNSPIGDGASLCRTANISQC